MAKGRIFNPITEAQISEMIASDPNYNIPASSDMSIEVQEGSIDKSLEEYMPYSDFSEEALRELEKKTPFLDEVCLPNGTMGLNYPSYYTKAISYMYTNLDTVKKAATEMVDGLNPDPNDPMFPIKCNNSLSALNAYNGAIEAITLNKIKYHFGMLQRVLVSNSWKYEALFKGIGLNLYDAMRGSSITQTFFYKSMKFPDAIFSNIVAGTTMLYQMAIDAQNRPTDYTDFAALTMEDLYALCNYLVPPMCSMVDLIFKDISTMEKLNIDFANVKQDIYDKRSSYYSNCRRNNIQPQPSSCYGMDDEF